MNQLKNVKILKKILTKSLETFGSLVPALQKKSDRVRVITRLAEILLATIKYASNESETTKKNRKAQKQREFFPEDKRLTVNQHLKITKNLRIYFTWDDEIKKTVICHCGNHLYNPNHH